ncbi:hypothetical protein NST08_05045 [Paenibacillus sp. FSL K6-1566]|uniref:hypothetical protein n=1 Tax=Paenibacillus TaxID=44249 RepID=UPI003100FE87
MLELKKSVLEFFRHIQENHIEIYNEFSLQHELGIFLRERLPQYKVQFERNVSYFSSNRNTIKKEIDISIFSEDKLEKYAIELKCPLNGQYPEQLYSFTKDIRFMEELRRLGFAKTACVALVSGKPFYQGKNNNGIYKFFREEYAVYGEIYKPTGSGKNEEYITLEGNYKVEWNDLNAQSKFYVIEIE